MNEIDILIKLPDLYVKSEVGHALDCDFCHLQLVSLVYNVASAVFVQFSVSV